MNDSQKAYVVNLVRNNNSEGLKVVMAVGDGYNDVSMLREANIGIQYNQKKVNYKFGDILIDDLSI